jgi:apolipoprotein N-acyltransferase
MPLALGLALAPLEWSRESGEPVRVSLLQGNVPQQMKFDPRHALDAMRAYTRAIAEHPADLVVLPETAWTVPWSATPESIAQSVVAALREAGAVAAIGMPLPVGAEDDWSLLSNSVGAVDSNGVVPWRYDKRHLVPFGEFVPAGFRWFVDLMEIPLGDFGRGASLQPALEVRGQRFAFNICYEDLFGDELALPVRAGASILVNVSNIGWFGRSHALPQHLQISRMRSIELARPMLRSTNTGMTAAIDARGRLLAALPPHTDQALTVTLRGATGLTPYARWGNAATLVTLILIAGMAAALRPSR